MHDNYPDLLALLAEARRLASDDRHIWCGASNNFDSRLMQRRGLLLGGAVSPYFLRDTSDTTFDTPWQLRFRHCRVIVCSRAAEETLPAWLPLMEAIVAAGESLLVVSEKVEPELLQTFIVNNFKGSLRVCAIHPNPDRSGAATGAQFATPPATPDQLLRIDDVWIRRTSTVCFPKTDEPLASAAGLQNHVLIETGGDNHDDIAARLRFLMRELQRD